MRESLFSKYVAKLFPVLQRYIELVNKRRNKNLTYWHKGEGAMLRTEYAPDNKWESTSVNTTFVSADFVAVDSELPIKNRDVVASANGKLPKIGMSKILKESDINNINVMEAQGGNAKNIANKIANDAAGCAVGIDEKIEHDLRFGLSNGYLAIKDEDNPNAIMRMNFGYMHDHIFGATTKGVISLEDIKNVISEADAQGNTIIQIVIAKSTYDALRQTREAKELVANYNGQIYSDSSNLPVPSASKFNEAFADDNNGITFKIDDRSFIKEVNGKKKAVKAWNKDRLVFLCNEVVGTLVYGRLAEQTNPIKNVAYSLVDSYKLISKYSEVNPLREVTSGQAFAAPIIEDVDQIYVLDISEAQEVDTTEEGKDTSDQYVTLWGAKYSKPAVVTALGELGVKIAQNPTDETIVKAINRLSDAKEIELKESLTAVG